MVRWCHVTNRKHIYPLPEDLLVLNFAQWWFWLRRPHLLSHLFFWSCSHVISRVKIKIYVHFHKTYKHQTWKNDDLFNRSSLIASYMVLLIMWSCDVTWKLKMLYLHLHKSYEHQTWQGGDLGWCISTYQVSCPFNRMVTWCCMPN